MPLTIVKFCEIPERRALLGSDCRRIARSNATRSENRHQSHFLAANFSSASNNTGGFAKCAGSPFLPSNPKPSP